MPSNAWRSIWATATCNSWRISGGVDKHPAAMQRRSSLPVSERWSAWSSAAITVASCSSVLAEAPRALLGSLSCCFIERIFGKRSALLMYGWVSGTSLGPSWVAGAFKKFTMPSTVARVGDPPCDSSVPGPAFWFVRLPPPTWRMARALPKRHSARASCSFVGVAVLPLPSTGIGVSSQLVAWPLPLFGEELNANPSSPITPGGQGAQQHPR
mmetsp:Transcript_44298/g.141837  ORF Transcript_44298/g.141837 Transcript_44298/m.141837 type:complete len:212 (-) Transcript_44298:34-669(-)